MHLRHRSNLFKIVNKPPTGVKAPPILEYITIDIKIGTGLSSITSHNRIVTGVIRSTVVTLSKNEDNTAVKMHKQLIKGHTFPFVI